MEYALDLPSAKKMKHPSICAVKASRRIEFKRDLEICKERTDETLEQLMTSKVKPRNVSHEKFLMIMEMAKNRYEFNRISL